jgi:hypothetical protein
MSRDTPVSVLTTTLIAMILLGVVSQFADFHRRLLSIVGVVGIAGFVVLSIAAAHSGDDDGGNYDS